MAESYDQLVRNRVYDQARFVKAVFSGRRRGFEVPWKTVTVRPVLIRGQRRLQFSYLDEKQDITRNYALEQAKDKLDALLAHAFARILVDTTEDSIQVQITRKGKAIVHRHQVKPSDRSPSLEHDRRKQLALPVGKADPFLQAVGIMTDTGKIRPRMRSKFRQVNEFLKLVLERIDIGERDEPLRIVDCGCGKSYLTFAVYHYVNNLLGMPVQVVGVDTNRELLEQQDVQAQALGWEGLTFVPSPIIDFRPSETPDVVLALHACDTATDEALAQAVRWGSGAIFSVPCCHHHLQQQIERENAPLAFHPLLRYGILRERLGDLLTDSLRAQILEMLGYRTDVVEFISTEHTAKNLMIRAQRTGQRGSAQGREAFEALKQMWQVKPYLETLLANEILELDSG